MESTAEVAKLTKEELQDNARYVREQRVKALVLFACGLLVYGIGVQALSGLIVASAPPLLIAGLFAMGIASVAYMAADGLERDPNGALNPGTGR